ncbi:MAG: hypothetical protein ACYCST_12120 [Acidimicrobiales bacterium]
MTPGSGIESTSISPDSPTRPLDVWAVVISLDLTIAVEGMVDAGRHLLQAKAEHPGTFVAWLEFKPCGVGIRTSYRLMEVAKAFGNLRTYGNLPPDRTALYELSALEPAEIVAAIKQGNITPEMGRKEARALVVRLHGVKPQGDDSNVHDKDEAPLDAEPATGKLTPADRYTVTAGALDLLADSDRRLDPERFVTHKHLYLLQLVRDARAARAWLEQVEQLATTWIREG